MKNTLISTALLLPVHRSASAHDFRDLDGNLESGAKTNTGVVVGSSHMDKFQSTEFHCFSSIGLERNEKTLSPSTPVRSRALQVSMGATTDRDSSL